MTERKRRHVITLKQMKICRVIVDRPGSTVQTIAYHAGFINMAMIAKDSRKGMQAVRGILKRLEGYGWVRRGGNSKYWYPTGMCHYQLCMWKEKRKR